MKLSSCPIVSYVLPHCGLWVTATHGAKAKLKPVFFMPYFVQKPTFSKFAALCEHESPILCGKITFPTLC